MVIGFKTGLLSRVMEDDMGRLIVVFAVTAAFVSGSLLASAQASGQISPFLASFELGDTKETARSKCTSELHQRSLNHEDKLWDEDAYHKRSIYSDTQLARSISVLFGECRVEQFNTEIDLDIELYFFRDHLFYITAKVYHWYEGGRDMAKRLIRANHANFRERGQPTDDYSYRKYIDYRTGLVVIMPIYINDIPHEFVLFERSILRQITSSVRE